MNTILKLHSNFTYLSMQVYTNLCTISIYRGTYIECEKLTEMSNFFNVFMVIFMQLEIPG